ncbi:T179B protein, partial [Herpetotheres cachinnans]|nr:T179B protein [Herpetotheres cachinnans]
MAVSVLQLTELALHGAAFLCGIPPPATASRWQGEFGGSCILYGTVSWNGTALAPKSFSHVSLCYFVSAISILVALYCFSSLLYGIYGCCTDEPRWDRSGLSITLVVVAAVILFFLLISACILRVGMDAFCASIEQTKSLGSCQEAEHKPWASYSPVRFYSNLYSAQASAWVNVFLWCLLTAWLLLQRRGATPCPPLRRPDPETEAICGGRPIRP